MTQCFQSSRIAGNARTRSPSGAGDNAQALRFALQLPHLLSSVFRHRKRSARPKKLHSDRKERIEAKYGIWA